MFYKLKLNKLHLPFRKLNCLLIKKTNNIIQSRKKTTKHLKGTKGEHVNRVMQFDS